MPSYVVFDNVIFSSDGGEEVVEMAVTAEEIYELFKAERLRIGNLRPDHDLKFNRKGEVSGYKKTPTRLDNWTDELNRNRAILGNLTWNFDPSICEFEKDEKKRQVTLKAGFITTPDSATRHRAIIQAIESTPRTLNMETKFSVRGWFVPSDPPDEEPDALTYPKVFNSYNQIGRPVDASVAKFNYQDSPKQRLAKQFVLRHPELGVDNVETKSNVVSASSRKLAAFNTISTAIEDTWSSEMETTEDVEQAVEWLCDFWSHLIEVLPDVGLVSVNRRKELRGNSLVATALTVWGYLGLADYFHSNDIEFEVLKKLAEPDNWSKIDDNGTVLEHWTGDLFSYDDPRWQEIGVLVASPDKAGNTTLSLRNARQTRYAMIQVLLKHLELA